MATYTLTMKNSWTHGQMIVSHTLTSDKRSANVTVKLVLWRDVAGGYDTSYNNNASKNFSITIGSSTKYYTIKKISTSKVTTTRTRTVALNADGTLSIAAKVGGSLNGTTFKITGNNSKTYKITGGAKETYKVTYDANGGVGAPASQTKTYGTALTLSSTKPTREADGATTYTFKNWFSSANSSYYNAGGSYGYNGATTMKAQWKTTAGYEITYSPNVTYHAHGIGNTASGTTTTQAIAAGKSVTLRSALTRNGYTFKGWATSASATSATYRAGQTITPTKDLDLYAVWTPYSHTVTFNANGGVGTVPANFTKTTDNIIIFEEESETEENIPTRNGYEFKGWSTSASGGGTIYQPGDEYTHIQNGGTVTLYANWISTDILLYKNTGNCKAMAFKEGGTYCAFCEDGSVMAPEFIEDDSIKLSNSAFTVSGELIEKI